MRATMILCDLDDAADRRLGVAVVRVDVGGSSRELDVCQEHLDLLSSLPPVDSTPVDSSGLARSRAVAGRGERAKAKSTPKASRRTSTTAGRTAQSSRKPGSRRERQARIAAAREWARANGRDVADRGRLPAGLLAQYEAAQR